MDTSHTVHVVLRYDNTKKLWLRKALQCAGIVGKPNSSKLAPILHAPNSVRNRQHAATKARERELTKYVTGQSKEMLKACLETQAGTSCEVCCRVVHISALFSRHAFVSRDTSVRNTSPPSLRRAGGPHYFIMILTGYEPQTLRL